MARTVRIKQGLTEGFSEGAIFKFLGVPYAEPPVGELRWRPPVPVAEWAGVRKAQDFGPICPQTAGAVFKTRAKSQSEDCLYLNVWTGSLDTQARQPVMVWIHGGGYLGGGGCEDGTRRLDSVHLCLQSHGKSRGERAVWHNSRRASCGIAGSWPAPCRCTGIDLVRAV